MATLKIKSLNAGCLLLPAVQEYFEGLAAGDGDADVICVQDIAQDDLRPLLRAYPYQAYEAMAIHHFTRQRHSHPLREWVSVGIAIISRYLLIDFERCITHGSGPAERLMGATNHDRDTATAENDALIASTERRVALGAMVVLDGIPHAVGTTHGYWTRGGVPSDEQAASAEKLGSFFASYAAARGGMVCPADYNIDRENRVLGILERHGGSDRLPRDIVTTVAPSHPGARFKAKPDRVLTFRGGYGQHPRVTDVHLDPSPGSDHQMLCVTIET